jgi:hypothetical protein
MRRGAAGLMMARVARRPALTRRRLAAHNTTLVTTYDKGGLMNWKWHLRTAALVVVMLSVTTALGGGSSGIAAAGAGDDPESVVTAAGERFAAGDKDGWLAYYADDAIVTDTGLSSYAFTGKPALGFLFDYSQGINTAIETAEQTVSGDTVTATGEWRDDVSAAAGASRYIAHLTTVVQEGKIVRQGVTYDHADAETLLYLEYSTAQNAALPPGPVTFSMSGSQPGTGSLTPLGDVTGIDFDIAPGAAGELQPAGLVTGGCSGNATVDSPLASVIDGGSTTYVSHSVEELQSAGYAVAVQATSAPGSARVSCGELAAAPAPAPTSAPAATSTPAGVIAPDAGAGDSGTDAPVMIVLAALIVGLGAVAVGMRVHTRR